MEAKLPVSAAADHRLQLFLDPQQYFMSPIGCKQLPFSTSNMIDDMMRLMSLDDRKHIHSNAACNSMLEYMRTMQYALIIRTTTFNADAKDQHWLVEAHPQRDQAIVRVSTIGWKIHV